MSPPGGAPGSVPADPGSRPDRLPRTAAPIRRCRPSTRGHMPPRPGRLRRPGIGLPKATAVSVVIPHAEAAGTTARPRMRGDRRPHGQVAGAGHHRAAPGAQQGQVAVATRCGQGIGNGRQCAPGSTPDDHAGRVAGCWASGEKWRSIEGSNPAVTVAGGVIDATSPPLLATPGGVASCHREEPSGRTTSCQKVLTGSSRWPMATMAHAPSRGGQRRGQGGTSDPRGHGPGGARGAQARQPTSSARTAPHAPARSAVGRRPRRAAGPGAAVYGVRLPAFTTHDWTVRTWPASSAENEDTAG